MAGMEIFNNDDSFEDSLEIDDNLLTGTPTEIFSDEPVKADKPKSSEEEVDDEDDQGDEEGLEVLLPPSVESDDDQDKDINDNSSELNPNFFSSLVKALNKSEGGIFEDLNEEDIKSQEDFYNVFNEAVRKREFEDLNDSQKEYLEALRTGIPHEDIQQHQQVMDNFNSISDESIEDDSQNGEALRRDIIMANFTSKGINEARAKKLTDKIFDTGEDIQEAKESLAELKSLEKIRFESEKQSRAEAKKAQEKAETDARNKLDKFIKDTNEIIPGLNIPQSIKTKIVKGLTEPVGYTESNQPLDLLSKYLYDNPVEGRARLAYLLIATDNMKNMGILESKKTRNKVFNELVTAVKSTKETGASGNQITGSKFNLDDYEF